MLVTSYPVADEFDQADNAYRAVDEDIRKITNQIDPLKVRLSSNKISQEIIRKMCFVYAVQLFGTSL